MPMALPTKDKDEVEPLLPAPSSGANGSVLGGLVRLLRPKQWTKNLLVFAALIFSARFSQPQHLVPAVLAFFAMCLISSATYVFNDLADAARDRLHPVKRHRPIASGRVGRELALFTGLLLLIGGATIAFSLGPTPLTIVGAYLVLQVLYNLGLKRVPVADVYCIATGFVLRAVLGAAAIDVGMSGWLLFCTGALALMLGFGKRRNEFILQGEARAASRESLTNYNRLSLDAMVLMFATAAALCYGVYTLDSGTAAQYPGIILTAPFVFYGITRYVLLIFTADEGGEPADILIHDRHMLATILLFLASAIAALNGLRLPFLEK
jgi:4-hydroxybenzoate polyprenyltransferase